MRARPDDSVKWLLDGIRYSSEGAYLEALRKRNERRDRLMRGIERDCGELLWWPGKDEDE